MVANVNSNATVSDWVPLYNHGPAINSSFVTTAPICVEYKVSLTEDFAVVVSSGTAYTSSDIDYTVKVEANKLTAFTRYYYQFNVCGSSKSTIHKS